MPTEAEWEYAARGPDGLAFPKHPETPWIGRLRADHRAVLHDQFRFVPDAEAGRIAVQFQVTNTEPDGSLTSPATPSSTT